jgi:hypothetical protein
MTISTAIRATAELTAPVMASGNIRLLIAAGGLGQVARAALFVVNMWSRVRMPTAAAPPSR